MSIFDCPDVVGFAHGFPFTQGCPQPRASQVNRAAFAGGCEDALLLEVADEETGALGHGAGGGGTELVPGCLASSSGAVAFGAASATPSSMPLA